MGYYLAIPIIFVLTALQSSIIPYLRWFSGQPNLVLVVVVIWVVFVSFEEGIFWAVVGGLMPDLLSVQPLGTSMIPLIIMVFLITSIRDQLYNINILMILFFVVIATIVQQIITLTILTAIGFGSDLIPFVRFVTYPTLLYNLAFALPIFWMSRQFAKQMPRRAFQ